VRRCTTNVSIGYLVDTNIPVYAYDPLEPIKRPQAIAVLSRLETLRTGALSSQILGEFFWNATRKLRTALSPEQAEY